MKYFSFPTIDFKVIVRFSRAYIYIEIKLYIERNKKRHVRSFN